MFMTYPFNIQGLYILVSISKFTNKCIFGEKQVNARTDSFHLFIITKSQKVDESKTGKDVYLCGMILKNT